jgi:hypothetical protein
MIAMFRKLEPTAAAVVFCLALLPTGKAAADQLVSDDLIVTGHLCTGLFCDVGEVFDEDELKLKDVNTRLLFDDTSSAAGVPDNDWRLISNDPSPGSEFFAIEDATAGRQVFRVDAGAPANSLRVNGAGRVGIGTATPFGNLHIRSGNLPLIRLEQDGSGGWPPQTWDIGGNHGAFFVRDVTGENRLPFYIRPGAPEASIFINGIGRVGLGTEATAPLHVAATASTIGTGNAVALLTHTGSVALQMLPQRGTNTLFWNFSAANATTFRINRSGTATPSFTLTSAGNVTIPGTITTGGPTCGAGCDRVFDADYELPSIEEHSRAMWERGHLPNVGPTPEGEPIDVTDKLGRMLNELEQAHIYIEQLQKRMDERTGILLRRIEALEAAAAQKS